MTIAWNPETREWHLDNDRTSWVLGVLEQRLDRPAPRGRAAGRRAVVSPPRAARVRGLRQPRRRAGRARAARCRASATSACRRWSWRRRTARTVLDPRYVAHRILAGKPALPGLLPATYVEDDAEADTLEIDLRDEPTGLAVTLALSIFRDQPIVARSDAARELRRRHAWWCGRAMSATLDLPDDDWNLVTLSGTWARERFPRRPSARPGRAGRRQPPGRLGQRAQPVPRAPASGHHRGIRRVLGRRARLVGQLPRRGRGGPLRHDPRPHRRPPRARSPGRSSRASRSPRRRRCSPGAARACRRSATRLHGLLAPAAWRAARGATGRGPCCSTTGRAPTSTSTTTASSRWPQAAKAMGIELFVLDDGWFGRRDSDDRSLGDWVVDRRKLPHGLDGLARDVKALGLLFGLWIEPEMVNPDSDLFRAHPDWAIGVPGRKRTESRQQLVLDFANPEVVDHIAGADRRRDRERADRLRQVGLEPLHHRAVLAGPAARPPGRVLPPLHPGHVRPVRAADDALPAHPVRVVRHRAGRGSTPGCWPGRRRPGPSDDTDAVERLADPVGHLARLPVVLDGRPRVRGAEPPDGARDVARLPGRRGDVRRVRVRAGPHRDVATTTSPPCAGRWRSTRSAASCSSTGGSRACGRRSRRTATRRRGWCRRPTASRAVVGPLPRAPPPVAAPRPAGRARAGSRGPVRGDVLGRRSTGRWPRSSAAATS